jgi:ribonuclease HII
MHSTDKLNDGYLGSGKILWYSRKKYGDENHPIEILEFCSTRAELKIREKQIVNEDLLADPLNINLKYGGEGGWDHLNKNSDMQRAKNRKANAKMKVLRETDPEWVSVKAEKLSKSLQQQYATGTRCPPGWSQSATLAAASPEAKIKRKQTMAANKHSQGEKNSQFGSEWITDGLVSKKIKKGEPYPSGFRKGRVL